MAFIYKITNNINNKLYIGKTERTIAVRWNEHLRHIDTYPNIPLYRAMKKYGIESFQINEIEECDNQQVNEREQYWIAFYNTYEDGYNCTRGGDGSLIDYDENELQDIIIRYQNGERLDKLCKEYHHKYDAIKARLLERGISINTHAGPMKLAKKICAIDPKTLEIKYTYNSIAEASRAHCGNANPKNVAKLIGKYKNTGTISHGFIWKTIPTEELHKAPF